MAAVSKAVLVTGCSSGIGHATALRLARGGWTVYATARDPDKLGDLPRAGCRPLALDVDDEGSMTAAVKAIEDEHGAVGVLINNAGFSQSGALETLAMDKLRRQFETNVFGPVRLAQLCLPAMRAQGWGKIVNVSSMGGKLSFPGAAAYHASKHAIEALSDVLRFEVAGFGVDVIVIEPGLIRTGFAEAVARELPTLLRESDEDPYLLFNQAVLHATANAYTRGPLARFAGLPDDVARAIEQAITARRAPTRVKVTFSATLLLGIRRWLSDRQWDWFVGSSFPQPTEGR